jgi:VIT1/CCC1 family predicted Fe2+/Mn2+ transporter
MTREISEATRTLLLGAQRNERTEHLIYHRLAARTKDPGNAAVLERIAQSELAHDHFWRQYTGQEVAPDRFKAWRYVTIARLLGLTFAIKLMERGEVQAQEVYGRVAQEIPEAQRIVEDEDAHEHELIAMLDEESLRYVGSMVLGLSDALVELTGALAGLTLAMQNTRLIGTTGLITGIAASLSMAASEFLSTQSQEDEQEPLKASLYTGAAYVLTVVLLILPYWLVSSYLAALGITLAIAVLIILGFTYYLSVARDLPFRRRFLQMAGISLGVAVLSFGIGFVVRQVFGFEV